MGYEQPAFGAVLAVLRDQVLGARAVFEANVYLAHVGQRFQHRVAAQRYHLRAAAQLERAIRRYRVDQPRHAPGEYQSPAAAHERLQPVQRRRAYRLHVGHYDRAVLHLADLERLAALCTLAGQQRLAYVVEVDRAGYEPLGQIGKVPVHLVAHGGGLLVGAPVQPVALDRVHHAHAHYRLAARHSGVHARKVVLDIRILAVPRRLIVYRRRIVTLGFAAHRHPAQMRHAHRHAQRRLPVALRLVPAEVIVPVGHAVQLAQHAWAAVLMRRRLRLLGRGELAPVAQHVYARQLERPVRAHAVAQRGGLTA